MKKTEWYSCRIKPVRTGWYESNIAGIHPVMLYWDGWYWLTAPNGRRIAFYFPFDLWRGLTKPT